MRIPLEIGVVVPDEAAFARLPERLPEPLKALAVPGEFLESAELRRALNRYRLNGVEIAISELAPGALTRLVPDESDVVRFEFYRMATERFRRAASLGIRRIGIGFDLERALAEKEFHDRMWLLLRGLFGVAAELSIRLRLPVRLPLPPGSAGWESYRRRVIALLPESTGGITLDFHIHDPAVPETDFASLLRIVRFDSDSWQITYEPELGNRPAPEKLKEVLNAAGDLCRSPRRVWFAPRYSTPEGPALELEEIAAVSARLKRQ